MYNHEGCIKIEDPHFTERSDARFLPKNTIDNILSRGRWMPDGKKVNNQQDFRVVLGKWTLKITIKFGNPCTITFWTAYFK
ncbi:hypothetical protein IX51_03750 [uncultured archaeon]|nr:hypothetical protein IX51_03750 [uncultured archaeon]